MPAHSDPNPVHSPQQSQTGPKKETIRIPLPQTGGGGKLPPVPPKVAMAAAASPDDAPRSNPPTPKFPSAETVKIPLQPKHSVRVGPAPSRVAQTSDQKKAAASPDPVSPQSKGWGTLDQWLAVGAAVTGTVAAFASLTTAEMFGYTSKALTWGAYGVLAVGVATAAGLAAKTLGLWPRSTAR